MLKQILLCHRVSPFQTYAMIFHVRDSTLTNQSVPSFPDDLAFHSIGGVLASLKVPGKSVSSVRLEVTAGGACLSGWGQGLGSSEDFLGMYACAFIPLKFSKGKG